MDFIDQVRSFSKRVEALQADILTEEATKTSLIMPFFSLLGYDVFNPNEFVPEFTSDFGIKKGEKVDYAIFLNNQPAILLEAKWIGEKLEKHDSQLFRYFITSQAKFAILTNGRFYKFYTDLEEPNKMDEKPFLEIDLLNIKDSQITELKKFTKNHFDVETIFSTASNLKYSTEFKAILSDELENPSDDFTRFFLKNVYEGLKTSTVIEKFKPILKKALNNYITELMNDRISSALGTSAELEKTTENLEENNDEVDTTDESKIITTPEEIESYYIVKSLLINLIESNRITFKDNERYFSVMVDGSVRKQICRIKLDGLKKYIYIPNENKEFVKFSINSIDDIYKYKDTLVHALQLYL